LHLFTRYSSTEKDEEAVASADAAVEAEVGALLVQGRGRKRDGDGEGQYGSAGEGRTGRPGRRSIAATPAWRYRVEMSPGRGSGNRIGGCLE